MTIVIVPANMVTINAGERQRASMAATPRSQRAKRAIRPIMVRRGPLPKRLPGRFFGKFPGSAGILPAWTIVGLRRAVHGALSVDPSTAGLRSMLAGRPRSWERGSSRGSSREGCSDTSPECGVLRRGDYATAVGIRRRGQLLRRAAEFRGGRDRNRPPPRHVEWLRTSTPPAGPSIPRLATNGCRRGARGGGGGAQPKEHI